MASLAQTISMELATHLASAAIGSRCFASVTLLADTSRCSPTSSTGYASTLVVIWFCTRTAPAPMNTTVAEHQLVEASICQEKLSHQYVEPYI